MNVSYPINSDNMKKILVILMLAVAGFSAHADTYNFLNFVNSQNGITQFAADGLVITFNSGKAVVTPAGGTSTAVPLTSLAYLEFTNTQTTTPVIATGDINGDGKIDVSDLNTMIDILLGLDSAENYGERAYLNGNIGKVDISDLNILVDIMLSAQ